MKNTMTITREKIGENIIKITDFHNGTFLLEKFVGTEDYCNKKFMEMYGGKKCIKENGELIDLVDFVKILINTLK